MTAPLAALLFVFAVGSNHVREIPMPQLDGCVAAAAAFNARAPDGFRAICVQVYCDDYPAPEGVSSCNDIMARKREQGAWR